MMADWSVCNRFLVAGGAPVRACARQANGKLTGRGAAGLHSAFEPGVCQGEGDGAKHCLWRTGTGGWWNLGFSLFLLCGDADRQRQRETCYARNCMVHRT